MAQDDRLARTANGDTLVLVPLVFDEDGYMHTARSFNALVDSLMRAMPSEMNSQARTSGEEEDLDIMFTDYETFASVISGETARRSGTSYAHLYAAGTFGRLPTRAPDEASGTARTSGGLYSDVFDPYTCDEMTVIECPADPNAGYGGGQPRGSNYPSRTPLIQWPELELGDIISGEVAGGFSAGSSGGMEGHTSVVTQLGGGGNINNDETLVMEAVGYRRWWGPFGWVRDEEVDERPARTYWVNNADGDINGPKRVGLDVYVRYHKTASASEIADVIAYARHQKPDFYALSTPKIDRTKWYCSKLAWAAYREGTGDDLDVNWGYWVFPNDIEESHVLFTAYHYIRPN